MTGTNVSFLPNEEEELASARSSNQAAPSVDPSKWYKYAAGNEWGMLNGRAVFNSISKAVIQQDPTRDAFAEFTINRKSSSSAGQLPVHFGGIQFDKARQEAINEHHRQQELKDKAKVRQHQEQQLERRRAIEQRKTFRCAQQTAKVNCSQEYPVWHTREVAPDEFCPPLLAAAAGCRVRDKQRREHLFIFGGRTSRGGKAQNSNELLEFVFSADEASDDEWDWTPSSDASSTDDDESDDEAEEPETGAWSKVEPRGEVPCRRSDHTLNTVGNELWVFGGHGISESRDRTACHGIYSYDIETKHWTLLPNVGAVPSARFGHTAVTTTKNIMVQHGNSKRLERVATGLLVFGGMEPNRLLHCDSFSDVDSLTVYDKTRERWMEQTTTGEFPGPRARHSAVLMGDRITPNSAAAEDSLRNGSEPLKTTTKFHSM
jgi:hypothetical protein